MKQTEYRLNETDRIQLSSYIEKNYGIRMPVTKKTLLESRLQKRAMELGFTTLHKYIQYLFSTSGTHSEHDYFATSISTHKTDFFRESDHFTTLQTVLLPKLQAERKLGTSNTLTVWSCASSTGEEVYTIVISIYDYFKRQGNNTPLLKIIGTDISESIAGIAQKGIYDASLLKQIPLHYHRYFMRNKDPKQHTIRIVPELRKYTEFRSQNLMNEHYAVGKGIYIIFCRNILIYFNKVTQKLILHRLVDILESGGYLVIGHTESIVGIRLPLEQIQLTIYRKIGAPHEYD